MWGIKNGSVRGLLHLRSQGMIDLHRLLWLCRKCIWWSPDISSGGGRGPKKKILRENRIFSTFWWTFPVYFACIYSGREVKANWQHHAVRFRLRCFILIPPAWFVCYASLDDSFGALPFVLGHFLKPFGQFMRRYSRSTMLVWVSRILACDFFNIFYSTLVAMLPIIILFCQLLPL